MSIKYDVITKNGTYKDKNTGEDRTNWKKIGVCMETRSGGLAIKLDYLPLQFDGWLQLSEPKPKDQPAASNNIDSDVPF